MLMYRINGVILRLFPHARGARGGHRLGQTSARRQHQAPDPALPQHPHKKARPRHAPPSRLSPQHDLPARLPPDADADSDRDTLRLLRAAVTDGVQDKGEARVMYLPFLTARGLASSLDARRKLRVSQRCALFDAINELCRRKSGLPRSRPRLRNRRHVELESISELAPDARELGPAEVLGQRPRQVLCHARCVCVCVRERERERERERQTERQTDREICETEPERPGQCL